MEEPYQAVKSKGNSFARPGKRRSPQGNLHVKIKGWGNSYDSFPEKGITIYINVEITKKLREGNLSVSQLGHLITESMISIFGNRLARLFGDRIANIVVWEKD